VKPEVADQPSTNDNDVEVASAAEVICDADEVVSNSTATVVDEDVDRDRSSDEFHIQEEPSRKATPSLVAFAKHGDDSDEEVGSDTSKSDDELASGGGGDTLDTGPKLEPVLEMNDENDDGGDSSASSDAESTEDMDVRDVDEDFDWDHSSDGFDIPKDASAFNGDAGSPSSIDNISGPSPGMYTLRALPGEGRRHGRVCLLPPIPRRPYGFLKSLLAIPFRRRRRKKRPGGHSHVQATRTSWIGFVPHDHSLIVNQLDGSRVELVHAANDLALRLR